MGCKLFKDSDCKMLEEQQRTIYDERIKQVNRRMENIEKIFEVLTNDSRLKDIIDEINKNQNNINNNVPFQQQEDKSTIGENEI